MGRCALVVLISLLPALGFANGRYPAAGQIAVHPTDPQHIAVRTTYGLVASHDAGKSWAWICETGVGMTGVADPFFAYAGSGRLLAATTNGLQVGQPTLCEWATAAAPLYLSQYLVTDVSRDPRNPERLIALAHENLVATRLVVTTDGGQTWAPLGQALPVGTTPLTLDIAKTTGRIYLTARSGPDEIDQLLLRSDDDGAHWLTLPFAPTMTDAKGAPLPEDVSIVLGTYLGAIDPTDANRLFVRVDMLGQDQVWQSDDGAQSWHQRFVGPGVLLGFALAPDASQIVVGGPYPTSGVWRAPAKAGPFAQVSKLGARCLTWTAAGLYACADEATDLMTVGRSTDAGATFVPLYHRTKTVPLQCPATSVVGDRCPEVWALLAPKIGVESALQQTVTPPPPAKTSSCAAGGPPPAAGLSWLLAAAVCCLLFAVRKPRRIP